MSGLIVVCGLLAMGGAGKAEMIPSEVELTSPPNNSVVSTPLSGSFNWLTCPGASRYELMLQLAGKNKPVAEIGDIKGTACRVALCPGTEYDWNVFAFDDHGNPCGKSPTYAFTTTSPVPKEITDAGVMFAGVHPESHWLSMDTIAADPAAVVSPWFYKKGYFGPPPPTFDSVKNRLPRPVWDGHEDLIGMYWYAWKTLFSVWVFAPPVTNQMAVSNPIGIQSWGAWGSTMVWDSAFILQFARYGEGAYPFITALDNCYARQHENGFICRESDSSNREVYVIYPVNPPLLAWAEWSYFHVTGDTSRIKQVFLPLVKQYEWYMLYQRRANGLYWTDGFNEADDSPRNALAHDYVSTTSIQALSADILSKMAKICGRVDMATWFSKDAQKLKGMVNASFWDPEHRLYNDLGADGKSITVTKEGGVCKHCHMFWPLLAGLTTPQRAQSMAALLADPVFDRPSGIASLSMDSDGYNKETGSYWRGSVWPPIQYMAVKGLETAGFEDQAGSLAEKYVNASLTAYKKSGDITEYLTPEQPVGAGVGKFVGWGGLAPIALFIEDIIGLRVDAPSNTIVWRLRKLDRNGVENLHFGAKNVSLVCEKRARIDEPCVIKVTSDGDFKLVVDLPSRDVQRMIHPGSTTIRL
ncbi:MAG: trehalase family glycosidase [Fimbriimonas sp.]|nr:trehalase family glycosidase [Fimbriimonas sp.]